MNLEALFEKYLREYLSANRGIIGRLEDALPDIYAEWTATPRAELGGKTPRGYVDGVTDVRELAELTLANVAKGGEPAPVAADKLVATPAAAAALIELLEGEGDEKVRMTAAELLDRMNKLPLGSCVEIVFDPDTPASLREALTERLKYDGAAVKRELLARVGETEGEAKKVLAELLVSTGVTDDRVYVLLTELLSEPGCLPLACQLLADYGDPRAIEPLIDIAAKCAYADFIEVRSAVERLGGDLPLRFDFEGDPTYKKIKGKL